MKTKINYVLLFALFVSLAGCSEKKSDNAALDADGFEKAINETSEKIILDVRTPEEFNEGHIANALLINFHDEDFNEQVNKLDRETPIYVYCASGVRSDKAATIMRTEGFKEVYVLKNGLKDWLGSKKEIIK